MKTLISSQYKEFHLVTIQKQQPGDDRMPSALRHQAGPLKSYFIPNWAGTVRCLSLCLI